MADYDVIIAGGGHNGLICAAMLVREGLKVLVAERNDWVGGGCLTRELTLPGFKHDPFGSSHVWIHLNPAFEKLRPELEKHGLKYIWSEDHITGHPNKYEGEGIIVYKDVDKTCDTIAAYSRADARRYREIYEEFGEIKDGVVKAMFSPPAPPSYLFQGLERNPEGLKRLRNYQLSSRQFTLENFENDHVRAFISGLGDGAADPARSARHGIRVLRDDPQHPLFRAIHSRGRKRHAVGVLEALRRSQRRCRSNRRHRQQIHL